MKYSDEELDSIIDRMKSLLDAYDTADKAYQDKQDRDHWEAKYGERLSPYYDKLKAINGDDFDLLDEARNEYHTSYSDLTDDEYVDALVNNIDGLLSKLKDALSEGDVAEAAHTAEEIEEKVGEVAENTDEAAHEEANAEAAEDKPAVEDTTVVVEEPEDNTSDSRYKKRSESNKKKLEGWDPQKRLSDEDVKEEPEEDELSEFEKEVEATKERYSRK